MAIVETVTSRKNPVVAHLRALARDRDRATDIVLLDGVHLLEAAHGAGLPIELAVVAAAELDDASGTAARLANALAHSGTRVIRASEAVLDAVSPVRTSSGVVSVARVTPATLDRLVDRHPPLVLALVGLQDPGNVGAIVRTAEAGGASGIIATSGTADPFGWKALRGAMGSAFRVPIAREDDAAHVVKWARANHLRIISTVPHGGRSLYDVDLAAPLLLILGGEGAGVPAELSRAADDTISIPMRHPVESLNVAVTAALVVYEAFRQRASQGGVPVRAE
jgi:TrmH family RNA methyltransferase